MDIFASLTPVYNIFVKFLFHFVKFSFVTLYDIYTLNILVINISILLVLLLLILSGDVELNPGPATHFHKKKCSVL